MTRQAFQIPLSPKAQRLAIQLAGVIYRLSFTWNKYANCWVMDIASADNTSIVGGIPVITGRDLLEPYHYLNFGGALVAQTDHEPDAVPTYENLGITGRLYFVTG